jgi:hypothetical protein
MATATTGKSIKGWDVVCPRCGDRDATITLDLNALKTITCSSCDETFTAREAAATLAEVARRWEAIARWLDQAGWAEEV